MAWSTPMTAVANAVFTAAEYNTYVRDNLLETAPAKASGAVGTSQYFLSTADGLITNVAGSNLINTSESTTSSTYTDLASVGPSFPRQINIGFVMWLGTRRVNSSATESSLMSVEIVRNSDSAVVFSPNDNFSVGSVGTAPQRSSSPPMSVGGFTPGIYTFTAKYRTTNVGGTSTATFANRWLHVIPF